jgi:calcium-translocating P-type ATPase
MTGLSADQVQKNRAKYGANVFSKRKKVGLFKSFLSNFADPMLKIMLVALGINCLFLFRGQSIFETIGIAFAILLAVSVSTISERSSSAAFEKLQKAASDIFVRVVRNGGATEIKIEDVVVGDIVLLSGGDKIPADGEIIDGQIEVDQSVANGESRPAVKSLSADRELLGGTVVTHGTATMRVTVVGDDTFYGKMLAELKIEQPKSPLKVKLEHLAKTISIIGYVGAVLVAIAYFFNLTVLEHQSVTPAHLLNAATLVVSVIVMAVPEGLPMMITVVLAANMKHMMRDNVLVRKLNGIETAGGMNILFTDKTGTITMGKLNVAKVITSDPENMALNLRYNNSARMDVSKGIAIGGNFTDRILLEYSQTLLTPAATVREQTPFDSAVKYMITEMQSGQILIKGAPEVVIPMCTAVPQKTAREIKELTQKAYRLIAFAVREGDTTRFLGLVAITDEVRPNAREAVSRLKSAGIQTVMITGDARETAIAVAREVGILDNEIVLTSAELGALTDAQLVKILPNIRVVARALPSDKSRLVRVSQSIGLVVGMTGDGVNDAPAIKSADVGFAMGSGTEVAKDAGDVVILDDNITSIAKATSYGRTIFKSIRKFLIFKLTINFVAMAISILAPFLGVGVPITVIQMLWLNIVMDTLAGLAYGGEKPRLAYMREAPKRRDEPIINKFMWGQIAYASVFIGVSALWFLKSPFIQNSLSNAGMVYSMTCFFAFFMFINIFNSFNSRTADLNLGSYLSLNKPFLFIIGIIIAAQVAMIFFGGSLFRVEAISAKHFIFIVLLALTIIPVDLIRKIFLRLRYGENFATT